MNIGVQIFGCLKEFRQDPALFFIKMKAAGITQIEPCIMFDNPEEFTKNALAQGDLSAASLPKLLWLPHEVPGFVKIIKETGLLIKSAHAFVSDTQKSAELMAETAAKNKLTSYVLNTPPTAFKNPLPFCAAANNLSDNLATVGTQLWLHNLGVDISTKYNGQAVYSFILNQCPNLYAQPDTGWVLYGGENPVDFINGISHKVKSLHFKDLAFNYKEKTGDSIFAVLGSGCVDTVGVLNLKIKGITTIIDQDVSKGDFFEDIKRSTDYLQGLALI